MPDYIYTCTNCKHKKTITQPMKDDLPAILKCSKCKSDMKHDIKAEGKNIVIKEYMRA